MTALQRYSIAFIVLILSPFSSTIALTGSKAVTVVPIADLVGESMQKTVLGTSVAKAYHTLPVCGGRKNPFAACPRLHQLLFNEIVEIVEERGNEVQVRIPNFFFVTAQKKPRSTYWTLKENVVPLTALAARGLDLTKLPTPISYAHPTNISQQQVITLAFPYYDPCTKRTFSAGTRFVCVDEQVNDTSKLSVYTLDKKNHNFVVIDLPKDRCIYPAGSHEEKIAHYVSLLRQWANIDQGFIPYVWGGCSFAGLENTEFREIEQTHNKSSYFAFESHSTKTKTGFDCSGIIARAAQICAIPYFFKNSTTACAYLKTLDTKGSIEIGDIVWIPGHVMVVSDTEHNLLIEARGYTHGYGKVQEIALRKVFKGINTYKDLTHAYIKRTPLKRLNIDGNVADTFSEYKILKISSAWQALA